MLIWSTSLQLPLYHVIQLQPRLDWNRDDIAVTSNYARWYSKAGASMSRLSLIPIEYWRIWCLQHEHSHAGLYEWREKALHAYWRSCSWRLSIAVDGGCRALALAIYWGRLAGYSPRNPSGIRRSFWHSNPTDQVRIPTTPYRTSMCGMPKGLKW